MKSKAKDDAAPEVFNDDMSWEDWVKTFKAYLRLVAGESGIPLSYVIRDDENPNMADQGNFLANYAARAPLNGDYYDRDNETVYVLIVKFTAQNTRAKDALKTVVNENDGREAFMTIKSQFEGEGIMQTKVTNAESTLKNLFYAGEKHPHMWWVKFEQELLKAHTAIEADAGRPVKTDAAKLQELQTMIKADWLQNSVAVINTEIAKVPMTMTFRQALTVYRNAVLAKYPNGPPTNTRRRIAQVNGGRGQPHNTNNGGRGGGRGGSRGGRGRYDRRNNETGGSRNHPDHETIVLSNGQHIKYHPSYRFTPSEMQAMTQGQRDRLRNERAAYRQRQGLPPRQSQSQQIAELRSQIASMRGENETITEVPHQINGDGRSQVSQVSIGTNANSIMGGRNRQIQNRQNNQRNIASIKVRTIATNNSGERVSEPRPGVQANVEMDSNADTCCLGQNFVVLHYTQRAAEVYAYDETLPSINVPIVSGATAYTCHDTNQTYILVVNEGLYYGNKLSHSLFNPNQLRMFGNPVWDNPFDHSRGLEIELKDLTIQLRSKGTKLLFETRAPTDEELQNCPHVQLTSRQPWNPHEVKLSKVVTQRENDENYDPRSNEYELRNIDPTLDPSSWREAKRVQVYDPNSHDIPEQRTFESNERHSHASPEKLSERWGISIERARATLRSTMQRGTRSAILPLARRYRADRMFDRPRLRGKFSTDTGYFKCVSLRGNIASQVYFHKCGFYAVYHLSKVDDTQVGPTLPRFISEFGIPEQLTMDGAAVQVGRKTTFMDTIRRANIDHHISGPYRPEENPAEGGIRELKRRFYRLVIKFGIPMRLWDFVLDYVVDIMNVTVNYSKYADGRVPLEIITGITPDITEYLDFTIYCWVYYRTDGGLGTNSIGRWLGVSHRVGPAMTYWILPASGIPISTDTVQLKQLHKLSCRLML